MKTKKGRLTGILLGALLILTVAVFAFEAILFSFSFFNSQVNQKGIIGRQGVAINGDNYRKYYYAFSNYLSGGSEQELEQQLYIQSGVEGEPGHYEPMFTSHDKQVLSTLRASVLSLLIARWFALGASVLLVIYILWKYKRDELTRAGLFALVSSLITTLVLAALFVWVLSYYPQAADIGNRLLFGPKGAALEPGSYLLRLNPVSLWSDFFSSLMKIIGVFCIPVILGATALARFSRAKISSYEDDYIYQ